MSMSHNKIFIYGIISLLSSLISVQCVHPPYLYPNQLMYDSMTKKNNFTKEYRISKLKSKEDYVMVSLDSLGYLYQIQAKYIYNNDEVNAQQQYIFSSLTNHLFLTDSFQRSPSSNKTLIQLYQQSKLIGYELMLTVFESIQNVTAEYEFQLVFYHEEDIDYLQDGTSTKFINFMSGDMEWRKINFASNFMEMMIFTLENSYDITMYSYNYRNGNLTDTKSHSSITPQTISKYSLKNPKTDQMILVLFRRTFNIIYNMPSIIDFSVSIISLFKKNYRLSVYHNEFANFDVRLPIFNVDKIVNNVNTNQNEQFFKENTVNKDTPATDDKENNNYTLNKSNQTKQKELNLYQEDDKLQQSINDKQNIQQEQTSDNQEFILNDDSNSYIQEAEKSNQVEEKHLLGLSYTAITAIKNVIQYEVMLPVSNHKEPYFLGATSTSCNSYFKYQVTQSGDEYSNENLYLTEEEAMYFKEKYANIDFTGTSKILVQPSEYEKCQPNCQIHAILHIEILVEPPYNFGTFKLQGSQLLHDLSNPTKPFFDYLPLLSYTFFKVVIPEDQNQIAIQYFSGFKRCYLLFSHSYIAPEDDETKPEMGDIDKIVENDPQYKEPDEFELEPLQKSNLSYQRHLQFNGEFKIAEDLVGPPKVDERPILKNMPLDIYYPNYSSGQMIIKPAKKGIHIFSALNISPFYSQYSILVNTFNLRQMTNSSYISMIFNGINDVQSFYYEKIYTKNNKIFLQFCTNQTDVTIYASPCSQSQNITSCPTPSKQLNKFTQKISAKNASIPDLCPNQLCHILFTIQYTPFKQFQSIQEAFDQSIKKVQVTLIEARDELKNIKDGKDDENEDGSSGKKEDINSVQNNNSKWIIIITNILINFIQKPQFLFFFTKSQKIYFFNQKVSCCILLVAAVVISALMCYIKTKQNKMEKIMKKQNNGIEEEDEDDFSDYEFDEEHGDSTLSEDLLQERTTTNSTNQNVPCEQFYE